MADARGPLAIVGVSALFPGSTSAQGFWRDILAGRDLITEVPQTHWLIEDYYDPDPKAPDKTYARRGGFLPPVEFDPLEHGVPPSIVPATDTSQLLALIVAKQVLDEATGGQFTHISKERTSVILGITSAQELLIEAASRLQRPVWVKALREHGLPEDEVQSVCDRIASSYTPWQESTFPGLLGNVVAGRIANRLDLGGTNCVTDAACASSFSALQMAASELWLGQSDLAIVGGVETLNDIFMYMCFSKTPALSPSGECRPFGEGADGTLLGEGLGMMAVRRLEDAERDGDRIYAVIRGIGSSSDGRAKSVYAPLPEGQARALRRSYEAAGYDPDTVELVEAHGTGTRAGDAAEFEGLRRVFDATGREDRQWCALGTVKSQIGHTKAAAGAAGLFKAVMAVHHGVLPPTLGVERPNPALAVEQSPFYLNPRPRPWVRDERHPRRASVSSFGFGGSNFHVTLEAYTGPGPRARRYWNAPSELVLLSADNASELAERCRALADEARPGRLAFLAHRSQDDFDASRPARAAVVASGESELAERLRGAGASLDAQPDLELVRPDGVYAAVGAEPGRIAFLFPGQGSQYCDMGADLAMHLPVARAAWDAAEDVGLPGPLHGVVFPPPTHDDAVRAEREARLTATEWAQPAIGVASQALLGVLRAVGVAPDACAGHSFGELTALHAAGALDAATLVRLARRRGERMAEAAGSRSGAMLAVLLEAAEIESRLERWGLDLTLANRNAPRQNVLSGETAGIEEATRRFEDEGVEVRRLPVSTAFHSPLVEAAGAAFAEDLVGARIGAPSLSVPSNRDARPWPADPGGVRRQLAEQIARPVRFACAVEALWNDGVRTFVEVGPGAVLTRLVGECLADRPHRAVALDQRGRDSVTALWQGLARLAVAGVPLRLAALREDVVPVEDPDARPAKPHALRISGANYAKPYPPPGGAAALPPPNPPRAVAPPVSPAQVSRSAEERVTSPAPAAASGPEPNRISPDAVTTWLEMQRQTAEAHETYLRTMSEAHAAYLQASAAAQAALTGVPVRAASSRAAPPGERPEAPIAAAPPAAAATATPAQPAPPTPTAPDTANIATGSDLAATLLAVVADKTGYPADMLQPEMQLEADLGVDSIKRVEILAALQERVPGLPEVQPADVASLRTLGQIADFLETATPAAAAAAVTGAAAEPTRDAAPATHAPANASSTAPATANLEVTNAPELAATLLAVVADKTGYPADMLQPEMQLEADLGVDSIKRVEILAALQERVPSLPEVQPADVASLRTLGQIADFLETATPAAAAAEPRPASVTRRAVRAVAAGAGTGSGHLRRDLPVSVRDGGSGLGAALAERLRRAGIDARTEGPARGSLVALDGLAEITGSEEALEIQRRAFAAVRDHLRGAPGGVVTVQDTGGDFGLGGRAGIRAWLGGLPGMVKTAAQEHPEARCAAVDLERGGRPASELVEQLARELLEGDGGPEVGLRADGARLHIATEAAPAAPENALPASRDVIVVTGGGRGVTAACARALARASRPSLALLGRTPLADEPAGLAAHGEPAALQRALIERAVAAGRRPAPAEIRGEASALLAARELRGNLEAIRATGARVAYHAVDVADAPALAAVLARVRDELGPITGVVHGAGVLSDRHLVEKTDADLDRVLSPKVDGLRALLDATRDDDLRWLLLFSSVAARAGNPGQADYALANEILNQVAAAEVARRGPTTCVRALGWGPWEGGMVDATLAERFRERGVPLIAVEAGAAALLDELRSTAPAPVVILGEAPALAADPPTPLAQTPHGAEVEVLVGARSHAYLDGHRIRGVPVVPLALALDWMARAAARCRPDLSLLACRDVEVRSGIRLDRFASDGHALVAGAREVSNGAAARLALELRDAGGRLHYTAMAEMGPAATPRPAATPEIRASGAPWKAEDVYDGERLFHGPAFQVIRSLEGLDRESGVAVIASLEDMGWPDEPWQLDAAALDGCLQLALLHARLVLGGATLPTGLGTLLRYATGPIRGLIRCTLRVRTRSALQVTSDAVLTDGAGAPLLELHEVQVTARPADGDPADTRSVENGVRG